MCLLKRSLASRTGYFPDFHLGIQDQRTAMSICAGCPLAPRALNDTLLRLVKSPLRRVPRIAAEEESETTPETENKSNQ
jgi:hypothetical protein